MDIVSARVVTRRRVVANVCSLITDNPDVAMDSIIHIVQHMTPGQRSEVMRILATTDLL